MKNNSDFVKYLELVEKYKKNASKAMLEEVQKEIKNIVSKGWLTPSLLVMYDLGIEKYRTLGKESLNIKTYDKEKSIRNILKHTFGFFLPKGILEFIPCKELIFHPHKPSMFSEDGLNFANLFIKVPVEEPIS